MPTIDDLLSDDFDDRFPLDGLLLVAGELEEAGGDAVTAAEEYGLVRHAGDCRWEPTPAGLELVTAWRSRQPKGTYPPGACSCGRTGAEICCTFASYQDGSTDDPTCSACCRAQHGRPDPNRYYFAVE
jgi:hypothetical protein